MRILIFNWQDRLHPLSGGAEVHLHEIFGRIARMGHEVTLVCCGFKGAPAREKLDNIEIIRIGNRATFNFSVFMWWLRNGKSFAPDIVIDDINKIPFLTPLFVKRPILAILHHFFGDSIYHEVGYLSASYVHGFEERIASVYRNTPINTVSESTRDECLARGISASNLTVIYNGISHELFPMRITEKVPSPTIVFFGRLKKYKSVDHLINAFAIVKRSIPDAKLEILGTGDQRSVLEDLVRELGLETSVTFRGYVADSEKEALLSSAHVIVNSSMKEGWGITNLEANACGTPVVSADVPGLRDSVRNGVSGLLYPYGDVETLANTLLEVLKNEELRLTLSSGAIEWASRFTWERSAQAMLELCTKTTEVWHR